jgi:hypothetical protein
MMQSAKKSSSITAFATSDRAAITTLRSGGVSAPADGNNSLSNVSNNMPVFKATHSKAN